MSAANVHDRDCNCESCEEFNRGAAEIAAAADRHDDEAIRRLVAERDANDTGERITVDDLLAENGLTRADVAPAAIRCHCGREVEPRNPDPWDGRMDDYCEACATNRCDCYPDECPVKYPD